MNIVLAMVFTAFSHLARKLWGQDIVDKALVALVMYALEKWAQLDPTARDNEFRIFVMKKLHEDTDGSHHP